MGFWEKVLPGYKGYREREDARNTDKLLRDHLAAKLRETRARYDDAKADLTRRGNLDLLDPAEKVTQVLSRVVDRLRWANYGFSGRWFGKDKIGLEHLEKVNAFDQQLGERVEAFVESVRDLPDLDDDAAIREALRDMAGELRALDEALNDREQILRTFGGEPDKQA